MLPHGRPQRHASAAACAAEDQEADSPCSSATHAAGQPVGDSEIQLSPSSAAAARADDGMAGSSLRAEAETLSLLPESQFWMLLQEQVGELNKFATTKERQIQADLRRIAARLEQHSELLGDEEPLIEEQSAEIVHLDLYIRTNHKALLSLCSHFDRLLTGAKTARWFSTSLLKEAYCNVDLERLVLMLSLLWGKYRSKLEGKHLGSEAWKPPDSFVRLTTKYWIRPENIVRAQCLIVRHLPFLVFGASDKDLEASLLGTEASKEGHLLPSCKTAPTQMVASVYFDSADAYCYERRIRRFEGAQLLRFRWYGSNNNGPDENIFIERKTHHESWSGLSSTKQRFVIPQRLVAPYMLLKRNTRDLLLEASNFQAVSQHSVKAHQRASEASSGGSSTQTEAVMGGACPAEQEAAAFIAKDPKLKKAIALGSEIQDEIAEHELQPMLRTSYLRAAFQLATSNEVRISLDTNLCMVNEFRPQRQEESGSNWCRLADELLGKDEVVRFPYAILEVKIQQEPPPTWVQSMLLLSDATLVYKFSKFQHGMAFLHRDKISSGLLPHWLQPLAVPSEQQQQQHHQQQRGDTLRAPVIGASLFESVRNSADSLLTPLTRSFAEQHALQSEAAGMSRWKRRSLLPIGVGDSAASGLGDWALVCTCAQEDISQAAAHRTLQWLQKEQQLQQQQALRDIRDSTFVEGDAHHDGYPPEKGDLPISSTDSLRRRLFRRHVRTVRKIDPKIAFAGERTFLHYVQKGLYLAGASLALVAKASAANIQQRIDSRWGPLLAFVAAGIATVLALLLQSDIGLRHVLHRQQEERAAHFAPTHPPCYCRKRTCSQVGNLGSTEHGNMSAPPWREETLYSRHPSNGVPKIKERQKQGEQHAAVAIASGSAAHTALYIYTPEKPHEVP
ncbi:vacuolar transporter chaperone 4 [Cyclospora cayetanensis]|uniref:Vacuolar transporter chaperone 4 n=1 Tax=Cyclospora cayetanensis TaxID=88456 RepID=A0A6P6RZ68_9EIME|nr:vacuolar transporter chaperone 4 [Cyclospora cayetanensis]